MGKKRASARQKVCDGHNEYGKHEKTDEHKAYYSGKSVGTVHIILPLSAIYGQAASKNEPMGEIKIQHRGYRSDEREKTKIEQKNARSEMLC